MSRRCSRQARLRALIALVLFCACLDARAHGQTAAGKQPKKVLALHLIRRDSPAFDDAFRAESIRRAIGGSVVIPLVLAFAGWYLALPEWLAYGLLGLGVLAGAVLSWGEQSLRANRYFKQRLWEAPESAAR